MRKLSAYTPTHNWPRVALNSFHYGWHHYQRTKQVVKRPVHDYYMYLRPDDPGISRTLWLLGDREREHSWLLKALLPQHSHVLDLGANIGYYTLLMNQFAPDIRITAVEPHPENYSLLKKNIDLNSLKHVTALEAAVADSEGSSQLHVSTHANVHSLLPTVSYDTGITVPVRTVTLGSLQADSEPIDFIRMDIEGYEQVVFDELLTLNEASAFAPTVLFELHSKQYDRQRWEQTLRDLFDLGYTAPYIASSNGQLLTQVGVPLLDAIRTDGRIRYIAGPLVYEQLLASVWSARCLVLQYPSSS